MARLLQNMGLARDGVLTLAGLLLFTKIPERFRPAFMIKAVAIPGHELHEPRYLDSEDNFDRLAGQYQRGLAFIKRNLHSVQGDQGINSLGILEIPEIVLQELLVNALIHRDYFISAPIRVLVFADRVESATPAICPIIWASSRFVMVCRTCAIRCWLQRHSSSALSRAGQRHSPRPQGLAEHRTGG